MPDPPDCVPDPAYRMQSPLHQQAPSCAPAGRPLEPDWTRRRWNRSIVRCSGGWCERRSPNAMVATRRRRRRGAGMADRRDLPGETHRLHRRRRAYAELLRLAPAQGAGSGSKGLGRPTLPNLERWFAPWSVRFPAPSHRRCRSRLGPAAQGCLRGGRSRTDRAADPDADGAADLHAGRCCRRCHQFRPYAAQALAAFFTGSNLLEDRASSGFRAPDDPGQRPSRPTASYRAWRRDAPASALPRAARIGYRRT